MEKIRYFKYLFFFLEKSRQGDEHWSYEQSNRRLSNVMAPYRRKGADSSISNTRKHEHSNDRRNSQRRGADSSFSNTRKHEHSNVRRNSQRKGADSSISNTREHEHSNVRRNSRQKGADFSFVNTRMHKHLNSRDDRGQSTSKISLKKPQHASQNFLCKSGSSKKSNDGSSDHSRQIKNSYYKCSDQSQTLQAKETSTNYSHCKAKPKPHHEKNKLVDCFNERDRPPNSSQRPIQNNNKISYTFNSCGVNENLKNIFNNDQPKSIMDYVKKVQSNSEEYYGFISAKILPDFEDFFYRQIYNFFLNKNSSNTIPNSMDISVFNGEISKEIPDFFKKIIFDRFSDIIGQMLNLNKKCKEIIGYNLKSIVFRLLGAYALNLFYYILDRDYYENYLFSHENFCFKSLLYECKIISHCYFYRVEAERVKELFTRFKSTIKERMEEAIKDVLNCVGSESYKNDQFGAKKLYSILYILMDYDIENISSSHKYAKPNFKKALEEKNYLSNDNSCAKFKSSEFIGIISKTHSFFLLEVENRVFYLSRIYRSYLVLLVYAHNNEISYDLQKVISEYEKYLDCFPQFLLKRKNFVIFKYLFGFYEEKLNNKFIPVFFKIIDSIIYHIKHSRFDKSIKLDDGEYFGCPNYLKRIARQTLWFMNKLGIQLKNKFAKEKSNYLKFWVDYNEAFSKTSMDFLYEKADLNEYETFKNFERQGNEANSIYSMTPDTQSSTQFFKNPIDTSNSIPDCSINNISYDDILDEFWYHFETENCSFDKNGNLIFLEKSSNDEMIHHH